ncbi:hypothetical protein [Phaeodactylibacter xiamenensis]|uniref:Uncharacterized protein n=1 Tax=Phaeodactylibacter xiamenensis TaxID=1524460 RepID=A0A098SEL9_9BACT|nr:hypothetical protein [Phaeodactylibacter xiamenensis]KGE89392.1 hypothetical protein IX84_03515 [Phaeodactylibacter xiamenensis]
MPRQWLGLASSPGALPSPGVLTMVKRKVVKRKAHRVNAPAMAWLGFLAGRSPFARRADYGQTKSAPGECPGNGLD